MTTTALARLIVDLDAAMSAAPAALENAVIEALARSISRANWMPPGLRRANPDRYARHVLHADAQNRYALLAIAWGPGQHSPVHGHYCWCGVAVYEGELTETCYEEQGDARIPIEIGKVRRRAGDLTFDMPLTGIHRIENHGAEVAVSLHVYGIEKDRINTGVNRIIDCSETR